MHEHYRIRPRQMKSAEPFLLLILAIVLVFNVVRSERIQVSPRRIG
jgi:hypothetical protein